MPQNLKTQPGIIIIIGWSILVGGVLWFLLGLQQSNKLKPNPSSDQQSITTQKVQKEYPNVSLFYENVEQIWRFNPALGTKESLVRGIYPSLAPHKLQLAYLRESKNDAAFQIHVLDLETKEDRLINFFNKGDIRDITWSPDSKYLVIDRGTSPASSKIVIDIKNEREIISFTTYQRSYAWIGEDEIVFNDLQSISKPRPYGSGEGKGITLINLNGEKKILKKANSKEDYNFIKILGNDRIYFSVKSVQSEEGWLREEKQSISYWTMNKSGNNLTQVEKIGTIEDVIRQKLPSPYNQYKALREPRILNNDKNWVVFVLNRTNKKSTEDEIFIMNLIHPSSLKKIGPGTNPNW